MKLRFATLFLFVSFLASAGIFFTARAQPTESIKINVPFYEDTQRYTDLAIYIRDLYTFSLVAAAVLAMAMIVIGGVQYIFSAGNPGRQGNAKDRITSAIYGLILLIGATVILFNLNPQITRLDTLQVETPAVPRSETGLPQQPGDFEIRAIDRNAPHIQLLWNDTCEEPWVCVFNVYANVYRPCAGSPCVETYLMDQTGNGVEVFDIPEQFSYVGYGFFIVPEDAITGVIGVETSEVSMNASMLPDPPTPASVLGPSDGEPCPKLRFIDSSNNETAFKMYYYKTDEWKFVKEWRRVTDDQITGTGEEFIYPVPSGLREDGYKLWRVYTCNAYGICDVGDSDEQDIIDWIPSCSY